MFLRLEDGEAVAEVKFYSIKISGFEHKGTKNTQRTQRVDCGLLSKDFTF